MGLGEGKAEEEARALYLAWRDRCRDNQAMQREIGDRCTGLIADIATALAARDAELAEARDEATERKRFGDELAKEVWEAASFYRCGRVGCDHEQREHCHARGETERACCVCDCAEYAPGSGIERLAAERDEAKAELAGLDRSRSMWRDTAEARARDALRAYAERNEANDSLALARLEGAQRLEALRSVALSPQTNCRDPQTHGRECDCVGDEVRTALTPAPGPDVLAVIHELAKRADEYEIAALRTAGLLP